MPIPLILPHKIESASRMKMPVPGIETPKIERGFSDKVKEFVDGVNEAEKASDAKIEAVSDGRDNDLHGTMIAMEQANIQLRLMGTVRNKVIEAYREVMRMGA